MYKWAGKQVYEPLPPLNGHYSIHSVNVSNPAEFGGGKTEALGVKTTADPRGTARTHWAARGKPSHPLDRRNPPTLPSAELPHKRVLDKTAFWYLFNKLQCITGFIFCKLLFKLRWMGFAHDDGSGFRSTQFSPLWTIRRRRLIDVNGMLYTAYYNAEK